MNDPRHRRNTRDPSDTEHNAEPEFLPNRNLQPVDNDDGHAEQGKIGHDVEVAGPEADGRAVQAFEVARVRQGADGLERVAGRQRRAPERVEADGDWHKNEEDGEVDPVGDTPVPGSEAGDASVGKRDGYFDSVDAEVEEGFHDMGDLRAEVFQLIRWRENGGRGR